MAKAHWASVFGLGFWINYLVSLLLTLWIPFAHLRFINKETGAIVNESFLPMYRIYLDVIQHPEAVSAYKFIALHLIIVFFVTYAVWYLVLLRSRRIEGAGQP